MPHGPGTHAIPALVKRKTGHEVRAVIRGDRDGELGALCERNQSEVHRIAPAVVGRCAQAEFRQFLIGGIRLGEGQRLMIIAQERQPVSCELALITLAIRAETGGLRLPVRRQGASGLGVVEHGGTERRQDVGDLARVNRCRQTRPVAFPDVAFFIAGVVVERMAGRALVRRVHHGLGAAVTGTQGLQFRRVGVLSQDRRRHCQQTR